MRLSIISLLMLSAILAACNSKRVEELDDAGNVIAVYKMRDSLKHGDYTGFYPDGSVFEKATYENGRLHGLRYLYRETGEIQTKETYDMGLMEGLFEEYHLNEKVAMTGFYVNNTMDGVWKKYTEKGVLLEEVTFKDNEENGPFKEYHPNGQLAAEGSYINGDNEHGVLKIYNDQGTMVKEMNCEYGICRTVWKTEESENVNS